MLESDPSKRITLKEIIEHEFLKDGAPEEEVL
jgi:serine/threonine protein kinase